MAREAIQININLAEKKKTEMFLWVMKSDKYMSST